MALDYPALAEKEPDAEYLFSTNLDFHINALSDSQGSNVSGISRSPIHNPRFHSTQSQQKSHIQVFFQLRPVRIAWAATQKSQLEIK